MKQLVVEPEAEAELYEGVDWYEEQSPGTGFTLATEAKEEARKLGGSVKGLTVPGVPSRSPLRRVFLPTFPYAIVFVESDDAVNIIAFAHFKKPPNYWLGRLRPGLRST